MTGERATHGSYPAAGIFAGATAWFVNTGGNYAFVGQLCGWGLPPVLLMSAVTLAITVLGGELVLEACAIPVRERHVVRIRANPQLSRRTVIDASDDDDQRRRGE